MGRSSLRCHAPGHVRRTLLSAVALALLLSGCVLPGTEEATDSTIDVQRETRERGDIEGAVGDALVVYGITAAVLEVGRVAQYSDLDNSGYIWARVLIENTTNRPIDFHRRHLRLEKPDGTLSNTASVSTESQIEGGSGGRSDVLDAGASREGRVIYTAGDLDGQFAMVYLPPSPSGDQIDRQRGIWVFESGPEQAE